MAEEFKVLIGAELDNESINGLKQQINGIKINPVKLKIDVSDVTSQINKVKKQIEGLSKIKINLSASSIGNAGNVSKTVNDIESAYQRMLRLQKNIGSLKIKIGGLDVVKNTNEVAELTRQLNILEGCYAKLQSSFGADLSITQLGRIGEEITSAEDKLKQLDAKVSDTKQNLASVSLNNFANDAGKIEKISDQFTNLKTKTAELESAMKRFNDAVNNMKLAKQSGDIDRIIQGYKDYCVALQEVNRELNSSVDTAKLRQSASALSSSMDVWLKNNSAAAKQFGTQIHALQEELKTCSSVRLGGIKSEFQEITKQAKLAGVATKSFADKLKSGFSSAFGMYFSSTAIILRAISSIKDGINTVVSLDDSLVDLQKTAKASSDQLNDFFLKANDVAKDYGATTKEIIQSAADWSRLGYNLDDSKLMSQYSSMFKSISPGMDIDTSTTSLVSTMKAYGIEAGDVLDGIISKINEIGNTAATSNAEIAEGLRQSSAAMAVMGSSLDENIALFTAGQEISQDASKVGNALRSITMRIRGYNEETEELDDSLVNITGDVIDLTKTAATPNGVSLFTDETQSEYKSIYTYLQEISKIYDQLAAKDQQQLLEKLFGKNRASVGAAILSNFSAAEKAMETMSNSAGSAEREMEIITESLTYKLNNLEQTGVGIIQKIFDKENLGWTIDGLADLLSLVDRAIDAFGAFPVLLGGITAALSFKGNGFIKLNADATGFLNKLTLMNVGLGDIGKSVKTMSANISNAFKTGGVKGGFSSIGGNVKNIIKMSQNDVDAIKAYNAEFDRLSESEKVNQSGISKYAIAQKAANNTMKDASASAKAMVAGANGGKVAIDSLGASMLVAKAKTIALQVATTALNIAISMGLSIAISFVVSKITEWINKEDEAREKAIEVADAAKDEAENITELYNAYKQANIAYENNTGSKEALDSATDSLLDALGIEQSEVQKLTEKYGDLDAAIVQATKDSLIKKKNDLLTGLSAKKDDALEAASDSKKFIAGSSIYVKPWKTDKDIEKFLLDKGVIHKDYYNSNGEYIFHTDIDDRGGYDSLVESYEKLVQLRDEMAEKFGDKRLQDVDVFNDINAKINAVKDKIEAVKESTAEINEIETQIAYMDYTEQHGVPKTIEQFESMKESIAGAIKANGDFVGSEEDLDAAVTNVLADIPELKGVVDEYNDSLQKTDENSLKNSVETAAESMQRFYDIINDTEDGNFSSIIDDYTSQLDTLKGALESFNSGELSQSDIVELMMQFPELTQYADNLGAGITKMMRDIISGSDDATSVVGLFNEQIRSLGEDSSAADAMRELRDEILKLYDVTSDGFTFSIDAEVSNLEGVYSAINESVSGTGLSTDSINYIKNLYSGLKNYDPSTLFERTENGIHLNVKAMRKLRAEYELTKKTDLQNELEELQERYRETNEEIQDLTVGTDEYNQKLSELDGIKEQITNVSNLAAQYDGLTSSYNKWIEAQSTTDENDKYLKISDGLENIKKLYEEGWIGVDDFREAVQMMTDTDLTYASTEKLLEVYEKGMPTMEKFFTGGIDGLQLFAETVMSVGQKVGKEWVKIDKEGNWHIDFGVGGDEEVAKAVTEMTGLQISTQQVQALLEAMSAAGFDINLDSAYSSLDDLKTAAEQANDTLKKLGKTDYTFNFNTTKIEDVNEQIAEAEKVLNQFKNEDGTINVNLNGATEAQNILGTLIQQKQELQPPVVMKVDTKNATTDIENVIAQLQDFVSTYNEFEVQAAIGADTTQVKSDLDAALQSLSSEHPDIVANLGIDTTNAETAIESIKFLMPEVMVKCGLDASLIEGYEPDDEEATVKYNVNDKDVKKFSESDHDIDADIKYHVNKSELENFLKEDLDITRTITYNVKTNTAESDTPKTKSDTKTSDKKGTAKHNGTVGNAFAHGNAALGGELGQELVVRDDEYFIIGGDSAEFFEYKKGDIIFNADQTRQLLENGNITNGEKRGKAFSKGFGSFFKNGKRVPLGSVSSSSSSDKSDKKSNSDKKEEKTTLDKFREWFEKLFDWIEIKLERQTDRIDKYVTKAENAVDAGNYSFASKSYRRAINATSKQISYEETAAAKYDRQADSVINKAVSMGLVTKAQADNIKKLVRNGTMDISKYSEEMREVISSYQEWYEKSKEASDAIADLHSNIRQYITDLKDMRDAQRDAKISTIDSYTTIATSGVANTPSTQNSQLRYSNRQMNKQNAAYKSEISAVTKDAAAIGKVGNKSVTNALKNAKGKKYKSALKNAQKAIKAKKAISSADLKVIRQNSTSVYNRLYAYNLAFDMMETARLEFAVTYAENRAEIYDNIAEMYSNKDNATNNKISLLQQQSANAKSLNGKNDYLDQAAKQYSVIVSNDKKEVSEYNSLVKKNRNIISNKTWTSSGYKGLSDKAKNNVKKYVKAAKTAAKSGKPINSTTLSKLAYYYSKGYVSLSFYTACINYNDALESKEQAEAQLEIDKQTAKTEKAAIGTQRFDNGKQKYENLVNKVASWQDITSARQDLKTTKGISLTSSDYNTMIGYSQRMQDVYERGVVELENIIQENLSSGYWNTSSQEYKDAINELSGYRQKIIECQTEQEELNNKIAQLPYEKYEKALELLDNISDYNQSVSNLTSAKGIDLSIDDYLTQINDNNNRISQYESERAQAYTDYLQALANPENVYGGMDADEWLAKYYELGSTINGLKSDNEDIRDAMRDDVYWRTFERAHQKAQALADVLSGINDLIDDTMLYDDNGKLTDFGVSQIANLVKQFENARNEVQNYTNDIQNLNKLYAQGYYNQDEFNEKLNELQNGLFDAASSMKSYISEIIDMNKKLAQSELDALFKLIDARNDALTAKKNYYDYDKTIKDKTKDMQALQAQIGALEGVETAEAKAQKARLEADLADKKDDLNDTIMNHSFELSTDALNELKTILQDEFDERWDNIGQDLNEIQKLIAAANELTAAQSHIVGSALNKLLSFYGINPTSTELSQFGDVTGYASGTRKVDKDKVAWTQENGSEVIIRKSDGAILTPLSRGDGVVPNNLTNNLFDWGKSNPQEFADSLIQGVPDIPKMQSPVTTVEQHYESLLNVEGNVDSTVVSDLEKFAKSFYKGAYNYTISEIAKDARKKGIKA